ncbi:MAG: DUF4097 family beta strand repeat-containing protein [Eubacteriales bacterium]|nr:DUF4097 family beta strand repeat-containing protein [Eubacteriales bacterium]
MKRKGVKVLLAVSVGLLTAGGLCLGAGVAMGGSPLVYVNAQGLHVKENAQELADYRREAFRTGTLRRVDIDLKEGNLQVVSGDEFQIEYVLDGQRSEPAFSVEDETLVLTEGEPQDNGSWLGVGGFGGAWGEVPRGERYVKLTVPEDASLEYVELSSVYGDIFLEEPLRAEELSVDTEYGNVECLDN